MSLGEALKTLRESHGYTQSDLADLLGVVQQAYSHYEKDRRTPDTISLYKISQFYGMTIEELMGSAVKEPDGEESILARYMEYIEAPENRKKLKALSHEEKELMFCFSVLEDEGKKELLEIAKLKLKIQDEKNTGTGQA